LAGEAHPEGESERRRYYRIGPAGREALAREGRRLAMLAELSLNRARRA
jgi:DNA-binding PadR family transcriptional regulator